MENWPEGPDQVEGKDTLLALCLSLSHFSFFFYLFIYFFNFIFPLYSKGVRLSLHVYITITFFPPPFVLLQYEYLDIVLNATQQDLLVNLF